MPRTLAYALLALGPLLAGLFFLPAYHGLYWSHPLLFAPLTALGAGAALAGGLLVGRSVPPFAAGWPGRLLRGVGTCLAVLGLALGLAALTLAVSIAGTGYWGSAPFSYAGDYLVMLYQIRLSQAAAVPCALGGLLLGLSWRNASARGS